MHAAQDESALLLSHDMALNWRHNGHDSVSSHQPHHCLLNRLFRRRSQKTSKLRVTGLCVGNSPGTGEFRAQMAGYAENVSIRWRHHIIFRGLWSDVITWNGTLFGGFHSQRASNAAIWCFLHCKSEQAVENQSRCRWFETLERLMTLL